MRLRESVAIVCALASVLGIGWLGCATGDEQVEAVPQKGSDGGASGSDTGGPGGDSGGSSDTAPPLCGEVGVPNGCATAIDLGTIPLGGAKAASNALPLVGGELWFKVTFEKLEQLAAHPRIRLTAKDPGLSVTVVRTCAGETFSCGGGDASSSARLREFEVSYALVDPTADAGEGDALGPDPTNVEDAFVPVSKFVPSPVYFKVARNGGATGCDFTVDLSN